MNEQEDFWKHQQGNEYTKRNNNHIQIKNNIHLFSKILSYTKDIKSVIEFGANVGFNLIAIKQLLQNVVLTGVEINQKAFDELKKIVYIKPVHSNILYYTSNNCSDMVLTKGFLIHIHPNDLPTVYKKMYDTTNKYICICEYYNPKPTTVEYHGYQNILFKRDFCKELMTIYKDLSLLDYGFVYHRDNNFPQDDITWFLLEKK